MAKLFTSIVFPSLLMACGLIGCAPSGPVLPTRTALEIRSIQTRDYPTRDSRMVMKAVLNVLQDEGFITKNAVPDLGLITATKQLDVEDGTDRFVSVLVQGQQAEWRKTDVIEANVNVSEFGNETRVRLSFQKSTLNNRGVQIDVREITDPAYYQQFLSKIDKGVFIQKERI